MINSSESLPNHSLRFDDDNDDSTTDKQQWKVLMEAYILQWMDKA